MMKRNLILAVGCLVLSAVAANVRSAPAALPPIKGLIFNEDCTNFFYHHSIPDGKAGETIDRYVDVYAAAGVKTLLCNTNAQRTNYRSRVWDASWDGYDPAGPDDQPFLAGLPRANVANLRRTVGNMLKVYQQGIDYPARFIARCRHDGISPWITLRMNDCHDMENPDHPIHGTFWKKNPQLRVKGIGGHYARCFDYAHQEVRDYYKALIVETLDRYDIDGLELDFMREPFLFSDGKEAAGAAILTDWLRGIRKLVDAAAARRGHRMRLGVRVPSRPETAKAMGLDAVAWAKEGLVDLIVPTPRWATVEFNMPLQKWRELLKGTHVTLAGGLEVLYRPYSGLRPRPITPELAVGAAVNVLSRGADSVYLFNYFQDGYQGWPRPVYLKTIKAMNSLGALRKLPRSVALTYRDIRVSGEHYRPPLPATGKQLSFSLNPGPMPLYPWECVLTIAVKPTRDRSEPSPTVTVNGKPCPLRGAEPKDGFREISFLVPNAALADGKPQVIKFDDNGRTLTIHKLELSFRPR